MPATTHHFSSSSSSSAAAAAAPALSRRTVLRIMAGAGAGLTLGLTLPTGEAEAQGDEDKGAPFAPNAFVRIAPDDTVTVVIKHLEMGQGVFLGLATLVAEELDARWEQMRPEPAPADAARYNNLFWGPVQGTGGSTSMANAFEQMRRAGAVARAMLVAAAARRWGLPDDDLTVTGGVVLSADGSRTASFGALATDAASGSVPDGESVPLKDPAAFRLIGRGTPPRPDSAAKVRGQATFASDVRLKGQVTALVRRPPRFGATVGTVKADAALAMPGVRAVFTIPAGVAVVADSFWQARKAREALRVTWNTDTALSVGSDALWTQYRELAASPGIVVRKNGDALAALSDTNATVIEATYEVPYLAQAPMEPLSAVARLGADGIEVWAGSQSPTFDVLTIAAAAGVKPDAVTLHTVFAGGSFGRRADPSGDYLAEVAAIARGLADRGIEAPVQLLWTREDDIRGGAYRPMALHALRGATDGTGRPVGWRHRVVCQSILKGTPIESAFMGDDGIDPTTVEGVRDLPYALPNLLADLHMPEPGVPVLWWRSVGHSHSAFAIESFVDEMAHAIGADPLVLRLDLLGHEPRHLGVLLKVAEEAGWGLPMEAGRGQGLAVHRSFGTTVAMVAEVTARQAGFAVDRLVCAVDCGLAVNPDAVRAQIEGGALFGLSAALSGEVTLDKTGLVEPSNFHDYRVLRMDAVPAVEVHIVPSTAPPSGVGEPGVPPVAPAVANALFAATGQRSRRLPLTLAHS